MQQSQNLDVFSSSFAENIFRQKYSMNQQEQWADTCRRVIDSVTGQHLPKEMQNELYQYMLDRKFIPAGRYLYASGRSLHQVNNCFLFRAEDSREGWSNIMGQITSALMTGGGIGVDYSALRPKGAKIKRTGGESTGPLALMHMVNEAGRYIMQGGARRSAIWAGLDWKHPDVFDFMKIKDWSPELRACKDRDFNFPLLMEGTNISVIYGTDFFEVIENKEHELYKYAMRVWKENCIQAFRTAEPGMSFNFCKDAESLRNAPVAASTNVMTLDGYVQVGDLVDRPVIVWTGKQWAPTTFRKTKENTKTLKISLSNTRSITCDPEHEFFIDRYSEVGGLKILNATVKVPAAELKVGDICHVSPPEEIPQEGFQADPYKGGTVQIVAICNDLRQDVFCCDVAVEEHSFMAEGVIISNCTEVTSEDDSDKCNLGTVWMNRCESKEEFSRVCFAATAFLMCGGLYSDVPFEKIRDVGNRNNRIGLGLGGMHEWLMLRGEPYKVTPELHKWLTLYKQESDSAAYVWAKKLNVAIPKGRRAIAPTGTIGIIAETTTGIEPLFCKAYKRRYLDGQEWKFEYVVDGAVKRLLEKGVKLEDIQDAYDISFKDRVKFQADVQNYVDMAISSTCNLPPWESESNNLESLGKNAKLLLKYAKRLRGFTCYPDGSRGGQPLTRVPIDVALQQEGTVFEEKEHECVGGTCGV